MLTNNEHRTVRLGDRTFLITGACSGIGRATAEALARRGGRVILMCRSRERAKPVLDAINRTAGEGILMKINLNDLQSVRHCAEQLLALNQPFQVLINNAGVAGVRGRTKDGFELAFGVNYLAHFHLTMLLLPNLLKQEDPRVINISSAFYERVKKFDFETLQQFTRSSLGIREYEVSKLANVMFTRELAARYPKLLALAVHPGCVSSNIWRRLPSPILQIMKHQMISPEEAAEIVDYCATSIEVDGKSGSYFTPEGEKALTPLAQDEALSNLLWNMSETWTQTVGNLRIGYGPTRK